MYLKRALSLRWHVFLYSMNCPYCLKKKQNRSVHVQYGTVSDKNWKNKINFTYSITMGKAPQILRSVSGRVVLSRVDNYGKE